MSADGQGLKVVVTGPTGDIGMAFLRQLDVADGIDAIVGMARRPFDPSEEGLTKVEYRRGDILDRGSVESLVDGADVMVHLAFLIMGSLEQTRSINLEGSRNVFEAAFGAKVKRLVYTSSVAAYGFHDDHPPMITEDVPARGSDNHYYSAQKAELEEMIEKLGESFPSTDLFVLRPCVVAGPTALSLITEIPYVRLSDKAPEGAKKIVSSLPAMRPVVPDPGTPFQLVHEDDVAQALVLSVQGQGDPGYYNLAGEGECTVSDLAHALNWYAVPVPDILMQGTAKVVQRIPYLPTSTQWIDALRVPMLMDTTKARNKLGWVPKYNAMETLSETVLGAREAGIVPWPDHVGPM